MYFQIKCVRKSWILFLGRVDKKAMNNFHHLKIHIAFLKKLPLTTAVTVLKILLTHMDA